MKIIGDWINAAPTQDVCAMLAQAGHQALFVGGCVRNALLDQPVNDIDIATDAVPAQVIELSKTAGLKAVPTGIEHGTVTVVAGGVPHEVTTFRKDVETFGRRAVVAYSTNIVDDARRRDFTMNALYARPDGTVVDPLGGLRDLRARQVRFVGDAHARITEDYLRILRFFRFYAWYGDPAKGLDADGLAAVAEHVDGLQGLSRERVGSEMVKLLSASDPAPAIAAMRSAGVLSAVLPGASARALTPLVHLELEFGAPPEPLRRLAALGGQDVAAKLRLSKAQAKQLDRLREQIAGTSGAGELGYRFGAQTGGDVLLLRAAMLEQPLPTQAQARLEQGAKARFPVCAQDLMPDYVGPELGAQLAALETQWIASGFDLSREELLNASNRGN